jgi:antitoxin component YwqK of YwqJK toxin-antitoxin module
MNRLFPVVLILFSVVFISSCTQVIENKRDYRFAGDGLIYYKDSNRLYSGTISDSSQMIMEYEVIDGKKNGSFLVFYKDGTLAQSGYLIDNKNVGEWRYYYHNGNLESKGMYINDIPQGEWVFYYPDGGVMSRGSFKDGLRHGRWYEFDDTGELKLVSIFSYGKFIDLQERRT